MENETETGAANSAAAPTFCMRPASAAVETAVVLALALLLIGCDYYKQQTGYLVTHSEPFIHHYEGNPCGAVYSMGTEEWERCELPETRYTLIHRGIEIVARCQSWDERNKCRNLQVGKRTSATLSLLTSLVVSCFPVARTAAHWE